ncbi:MAG: hypothetical protein H6851_11100 [Geminicoccaceae bacterium]|nr:hypothetical protein [Geminicoccaceae bacterium]MCB9944149.1 hypothetical protein [Geminicoccaceae bacterium]
MIMELVATFALGLGVAGVVLVLRFLSRGRLPGYLVPIAAGLGMITFTIWGEYSWFSRVEAGLPDNVVVLGEFSNSVPYRPWTYVFPQINRFSAVDLGSRKRHPDHPDLNMVDVFLVAHREPTRTLTMFVDCAGRRSAEVDGALMLDDNGAPEDANWIGLDGSDPLLVAVCQKSG